MTRQKASSGLFYLHSQLRIIKVVGKIFLSTETTHSAAEGKLISQEYSQDSEVLVWSTF